MAWEPSDEHIAAIVKGLESRDRERVTKVVGGLIEDATGSVLAGTLAELITARLTQQVDENTAAFLAAGEQVEREREMDDRLSALIRTQELSKIGKRQPCLGHLIGVPPPASLAPSAHCSACLPPIFAPLRWGRPHCRVVLAPRSNWVHSSVASCLARCRFEPIECAGNSGVWTSVGVVAFDRFSPAYWGKS
jgi:hypothetical protein